MTQEYPRSYALLPPTSTLAVLLRFTLPLPLRSRPSSLAPLAPVAKQLSLTSFKKNEKSNGGDIYTNSILVGKGTPCGIQREAVAKPETGKRSAAVLMAADPHPNLGYVPN